MCPHTPICVLILLYVSSYSYILCLWQNAQKRKETVVPLYLSPHTAIYVSCYYSYYECSEAKRDCSTTVSVSSYCYICVLILPYMCPHTVICVLILLYMCPRAAIDVSSYYYMCVLTLLYMCPHTYCYTCVLILLYVCVLMLLYIYVLILHRCTASGRFQLPFSLLL
jgi:hypothetical protein